MSAAPALADIPRPIAFAASSAAAQVGKLRAVAEAAIAPDLIVGTSAGACCATSPADGSCP
jgi:predicted acylesterase/phospholipase RssA